jgi:putative transposon-encoded protein
MSRKVFVLDNKLSLTDDQIEGILERTVTKQGTSAKADVPRRYLGKRVYIVITKSDGNGDQE